MWAICLCAGVLLPAGIFYWSHVTTDKHRDLIATGGGDVRFVAAISADCKPQPKRRNYRGGGTNIPWGRRVEIVAQENGLGLTSYLGNPCWLEMWTLREAEPVIRPGFQGRDYARPPPGWVPYDR